MHLITWMDFEIYGVWNIKTLPDLSREFWQKRKGMCFLCHNQNSSFLYMIILQPSVCTLELCTALLLWGLFERKMNDWSWSKAKCILFQRLKWFQLHQKICRFFWTCLKMQTAQLCLIPFLWPFCNGFDCNFTRKQQINSSDYKMKIISISVLLQSSGIGT